MSSQIHYDDGGDMAEGDLEELEDLGPGWMVADDVDGTEFRHRISNSNSNSNSNRNRNNSNSNSNKMNSSGSTLTRHSMLRLNGPRWCRGRTEGEAARHMERCEEMLQCQRQIKFYRERLEKLKQEHKRHVRKEQLRIHAETIWPTLSKREQYRRDILWEIANHSPSLPDNFTSLLWGNVAPSSAHKNLDLLWAILRRPDVTSTPDLPPWFWNVQRWNSQELFELDVLPVAFTKCPKAALANLSLFRSCLTQHATLYFKALLHCHDAPCMDYVDTFCQACPELRNDPDAMLHVWKTWALTNRDMSPRLLGKHLKNTVEFALDVAHHANTIPSNALRSFTPRLRGHAAVVLAFCHRNGDALGQASLPMRHCFRVVRAASLQYPLAFRHAASKCKTILSSNKLFMISLFQRHRQLMGANASAETTQALLRLCHPSLLLSSNHKYNQNHSHSSLRDSWDVCLQAARAGYQALPKRWVHNKTFWWNAAMMQPMPLADLPPRFQKDPDLAITCLHQTALHCAWFNPASVRTVMVRSPELLQDERCVLPLMLYYKIRGYTDEFLLEYWPLIPSDFFGRKTIMIPALKLHASTALQWMSMDLLHDREIVRMAVAQLGSAALEHIPDTAQLLFPDLVALAIRTGNRPQKQQRPLWQQGSQHEPNFDEDPEDDDGGSSNSQYSHEDEEENSTSLWSLFDHIPLELWSNREVALAWVNRGGDYLHEEFPPEFQEDPELFLALAKHNWCDFMFASNNLLSDFDFMKRAVTENGLVLLEGRDGLDTNFDLAVIAFGNQPDLVDHYEWSTVSSPDFEFLVNLARQVRHSIQRQEAFWEFLKGVLQPQPLKKSKKNLLGMLNVGRETTLAMAQLIAKYVGIPVGKDLAVLRQVSANLAAYGF